MSPSASIAQTDAADLHQTIDGWSVSLDSCFEVSATHVSRLSSGETLDPAAPDSVAVRKLARWIYTDVHLHGEDSGTIPRNTMDHPWLSQLQPLKPKLYPSRGWTERADGSGLLERSGVIVRPTASEQAYTRSNGSGWDLLLPRVRPGHTYGWHFVVGADGPASSPPSRLYAPSLRSMPVLEIAAALDSGQGRWQMKFLADQHSRRPDRVVVYTSSDGCSATRTALAAIASNDEPGPGFSIRTAPGVYECLPHSGDAEASYGLVVSLMAARSILSSGRIDAKDLLRGFKELS